MNLFSPRASARTTLFSWLFLCALVTVCITLGIFQYRWISEVSQTAREHLTEGLRANLLRLSRDFNTEISSATVSLAQFSRERDGQAVESQLGARFAQWRNTARHPRIFDRIALAVPDAGAIALRMLDLDHGTLAPAEWPVEWSAIRSHIESTASGIHGGRGPGPPRGNDGFAFEVPVFGAPEDDGGPGRRFGPREPEIAWVILNLNLQYVRGTILPELLQRDLGSNGALDYQVEIVARNNPDSVIFQSGSQQASAITESADASVSLFEPGFDFSARRGGPAPLPQIPTEDPDGVVRPAVPRPIWAAGRCTSAIAPARSKPLWIRRASAI